MTYLTILYSIYEEIIMATPINNTNIEANQKAGGGELSLESELLLSTALRLLSPLVLDESTPAGASAGGEFSPSSKMQSNGRAVVLESSTLELERSPW